MCLGVTMATVAVQPIDSSSSSTADHATTKRWNILRVDIIMFLS